MFRRHSSTCGGEEKLTMLGESYKEVLDATKHQDDKVGRLLTAAAFWTSGSLALLAFDKGSAIKATWDNGMGHLTIYFATAYLLLISAASLQLVNSIMTPLTLPSKRPPRADYPSQLYFLSISRYSKKEWEEYWRGISCIDHDRIGMYAQENYNIATRATFKYARTTEAVALLQLSLLAFSGLIVLSLQSINRGVSPVKFTWHVALLLGISASGWVVLTLGIRAMATRVHLEKSKSTRTRHSVIRESSGVLLISSSCSLAVWSHNSYCGFMSTSLALLFGTFLLIKRERSIESLNFNLFVLLGALACIVVSFLSMAKESWLCALGAIYVVPLTLGLATLFGPLAQRLDAAKALSTVEE